MPITKPKSMFQHIKYNYAYYPVVFSSEECLVETKNMLSANGIVPRRYFYPSLNESFIIEGFISAIMLFAGGFGGILLYQASLNAFNRSYAIKLMVIGLVLSMVSFFVLQWIIRVKLGLA